MSFNPQSSSLSRFKMVYGYQIEYYVTSCSGRYDSLILNTFTISATIELSSMNKVSLFQVYSCSDTGATRDYPY